MSLRITKASDYALRAMIHLASLPEDKVVLRNEVADALDIPSSFMAKILRRLVRAKLLDSSRGVHGGFSLGRPTVEINMLDIVEAVEGPLNLTDCAADPAGCVWSCECPAAAVWARVQDGVKETLRLATLEELVSTPRRKGHVFAGGRSRGDQTTL